MSAPSQLGNSVVAAVEMACMIYRVRCYRMQSRAVNVVGAGGRMRPMFMGQWRDQDGTIHRAGMADLLLTPMIRIDAVHRPVRRYMAVALWVECKAGSGRLTDEQEAFKADVEAAGAFYIECRDSAEPVIDWLREQGIDHGGINHAAVR